MQCWQLSSLLKFKQRIVCAVYQPGPFYFHSLCLVRVSDRNWTLSPLLYFHRIDISRVFSISQEFKIFYIYDPLNLKMTVRKALIFASYVWGIWDKERKWLIEDHIVNKWQSQESNHVHLTLKTSFLHQAGIDGVENASKLKNLVFMFIMSVLFVGRFDG